ncbi:MAG: HIT family protein [Chloroflexota bacterium]
MGDCYTCELSANRDSDEAPLWDNIYRTAHWDVVHSYNTRLPGWMVLISRRHIEAIDEMTPAEATELGLLLQRVSHALKQVVQCQKTYVLQFAEHPKHPHVHFHVTPKMAEQPYEMRSYRIMGYLGASEAERVSEAEMNRIGAQIRAILIANQQ